MNDRFKFRAYNKESKKIYDVRELGFMRDTLELVDICLEKPNNDAYGIEIESIEEYIVMQCTGLKDKNGKLIYEGDIIKENWHTYIVGYDRGYSIKDIETKHSYTINALCNEKAEVIGNIYENPELLEGNND